MTQLMAGKRGLIMGLANDKSLAWGIAQKLREHGAELAFSYQGEALGKRVIPLAEQLGSDFCFDCDVSDMAALDTAFDTLKSRWDTLDFVVHAIGFSDKNELRGKYLDTSLDNFLMTMNISAYSLVAVARRAAAMMPPLAEDGRGGGSILTLSYYGAEKVIPHYNVMGVAKAALETSVKYLANDLGPRNIRVNARALDLAPARDELDKAVERYARAQRESKIAMEESSTGDGCPSVHVSSVATPSMSVSNFAFGCSRNSVCTYTFPRIFSERSRALQACLSTRE